jgi:L-cysteine/cystine lyase
MNIAVWGINWRMGDEIVTTTTEHEGGFMPVYLAARRFGLGLRTVDIGDHADPAPLIAALTPRTRLVVVSHVQWKTGAVLPLGEVAQAAHRVGALVAVDGAQSAGAIPINVREMGVDFYAAPGQKWLCGPEGTGALYVRRERLSELAPTFAGYFTLAPHPAADPSGYFLPAPGASRFEVSTVYWPALYGLSESLRWLEEDLGHAWVYAQRQAITERCREVLAETPGVTMHSPAEGAGLTAFSVAGLDPTAAFDALMAMKVMIRWVHDPDRLRVSTHFFNNEEDVLRLRDALLKLRSEIGK